MPLPFYCKSFAKESIKILNKVGLNGHPYFTPLEYLNFGDSPKTVRTVL